MAVSLHVEALRGRLQDLFTLRHYFEQLEPRRYRLIVLDAFYRFLPVGTDENDNGAMAHLYNVLDSCAARLECAFVLIHHASKGSQADKSVTDVGAGAGSMARATDTHLILRPHEEDNVVVLDCAARSWPPLGPHVPALGVSPLAPCRLSGPDTTAACQSQARQDCAAGPGDYPPPPLSPDTCQPNPRTAVQSLPVRWWTAFPTGRPRGC